MIEFFTRYFVNFNSNIDNHLESKRYLSYLLHFFERIAQRYIDKTNQILSNFKYYQPYS